MTDKDVNFANRGSKAYRSAEEIMADPTLSNASKAELLRGLEKGGGSRNAPVEREADLELDKLLKLNSLANER